METEPAKFKQKYRIESTRLKGYDYSQNGAYFVTICTRDKERLFGDIVGGEMRYSALGRMAKVYWEQIPEHFPFATLDEWVVMPNHIHGIICIQKSDMHFPVETCHWHVSTQRSATQHESETCQWHVSTAAPRFTLQKESISSIVNQFKGIVTKYARSQGVRQIVWQSRFHDRIIRNESELNCIREYIRDNPKNWEQDENFL